jgi:hypothetical protein
VAFVLSSVFAVPFEVVEPTVIPPPPPKALQVFVAEQYLNACEAVL